MRFLISLICAAALGTLPVTASAQTPDEGKSVLERWHPEAFVEPDPPKESEARPTYATEPVLRLELDPAGFTMTPQEPLSFERIAREEERAHKRRVGLGVGISLAAVVITGVALGAMAATISRGLDDW